LLTLLCLLRGFVSQLCYNFQFLLHQYNILRQLFHYYPAQFL
jgi:hypothetical protein